jgi:hypothetical protein
MYVPTGLEPAGALVDFADYYCTDLVHEPCACFPRISQISG